MQQIVCGNCGGKIKLPGGFSKAKIRCDLCGYYAAVPPEMRSAAPAEDDAPPPPKKKSTAKPARPSAPDDDDDTPTPAPPKRTVVTPVSDDARPARRAESPPPAKPIRARAKTDPKDKRPEFIPQEGTGKAYLEGNQDEDDPTPYGVEGDGLMRCPECQQELPHDATFCVHCGAHLTEDGEPVPRRPKKKRKYTEIDQSFGEGFPLTTRIALMGGVLLLNVILTLSALFGVSDDGRLDGVAVVTGGFAFLVNSGMQAFIIGTFDTLRVRRDEKGKGTLTRLRRVAFIPMNPMPIEWKHLTGVGRVATHSGGIIDWVTCLYLLMSGCLPGILFWWFVLKPERYHAVLCNMYGGIEETLFRGKSQDQAEEIADLVGEATGLEVRGIL